MNGFKSILITGATGFVGAHLIRHFTPISSHVIGLGRKAPPEKLLKTGASYHLADLRSNALPQEADIIIHSAGLASESADWDALYENNVIGTKNLLENVRYKLFIYISSASVYPISDKPHREDDLIQPKLLNDYGRSKYMAEEVVSKYPSTIILRPRAIYGTHDRVLLPKILGLKKGNSILTPCDVSNTVSLTNIINLIHAIELCIKKPSIAEKQVFNVSDGMTYILKDIIAKLFYRIYDHEIPIRTIPYRISKSISKLLTYLPIDTKLTKTSLDMICHNHVLSINKIRSVLSYSPDTNFETYLPELVKWIEEVSVDRIIRNPSGAPWEMDE